MKILWKKLVLCALSALAFLCVLLPVTGLRQAGLLAVLLLTILLWITNAVPKWLSSLFLLLMFSLLSSAPLRRVVQFPLSKNFLMVVFSYLFSEGLKNSGLFYCIVPWMQRCIKGVFSLLLSVLLLTFIMIWAVPQPFARIVILLQLYTALFRVWQLPEKTTHILCFGIVNTGILFNSAFLRGDIILNTALLNVSSLSMSELLWAQWMLVPTLLLCVLGTALFYAVFYKELLPLRQLRRCDVIGAAAPLSSPALVISVVTVLLWLTESWTGIPSSYTVMGASAALALCGLLHIRDLRCINLELMLFLTAAFSIGPVMTADGIADRLLDLLLPLLPKTFDICFAVILVVCCMILHMVLGSCVTAISVAIPAVILLGQASMPVYPLAFLAFLAIVGQYVIPLHNVSLMVGQGQGNYSQGEVVRYGSALTALEIVALPVLYLAWWRIAGLL